MPSSVENSLSPPKDLFQVTTHQTVQHLAIHVFSASHQTIARNPVVKKVIQDQTRPVFLLDTSLILLGIGKVANADCDQRLTIGLGCVVSRYSGKDRDDIPFCRAQNRLLFLNGGSVRAGEWILLNGDDCSYSSSPVRSGLRIDLANSLPSSHRTIHVHSRFPSGRPFPLLIVLLPILTV